MKRYVVAPLSELPPGSRKIVDADGRSIGVLNVKGALFALRNFCPHQGAPLCIGKVQGTIVPGPPYQYVYGRDDEILKCPWHGWEFEVATGRSIFNPHRVRVRSYPVSVGVPEDNDVWLETFDLTVEEGVVILHA